MTRVEPLAVGLAVVAAVGLLDLWVRVVVRCPCDCEAGRA